MDSVRRRMEEVGILLLRLSFPLLAVAAGVGVEWILVLRVDPGELRFLGFSCEVAWSPLGYRMDLLWLAPGRRSVFEHSFRGARRFAGGD